MRSSCVKGLETWFKFPDFGGCRKDSSKYIIDDCKNRHEKGLNYNYVEMKSKIKIKIHLIYLIMTSGTKVFFPWTNGIHHLTQLFIITLRKICKFLPICVELLWFPRFEILMSIECVNVPLLYYTSHTVCFHDIWK